MGAAQAKPNKNNERMAENCTKLCNGTLHKAGGKSYPPTGKRGIKGDKPKRIV